MMMMRDLLNAARKEKRREATMKTVRMIGLGAGIAAVSMAAGGAAGILFAPKSGKETRAALKMKAENTLETLKESAAKKAEAVKNFAENAAKDVHRKTEDVKNDTKDGCHEVKQDILKTAEHISKDINL